MCWREYPQFCCWILLKDCEINCWRKLISFFNDNQSWWKNSEHSINFFPIFHKSHFASSPCGFISSTCFPFHITNWFLNYQKSLKIRLNKKLHKSRKAFRLEIIFNYAFEHHSTQLENDAGNYQKSVFTWFKTDANQHWMIYELKFTATVYMGWTLSWWLFLIRVRD